MQETNTAGNNPSVQSSKCPTLNKKRGRLIACCCATPFIIFFGFCLLLLISYDGFTLIDLMTFDYSEGTVDSMVEFPGIGEYFSDLETTGEINYLSKNWSHKRSIHYIISGETSPEAIDVFLQKKVNWEDIDYNANGPSLISLELSSMRGDKTKFPINFAENEGHYMLAFKNDFVYYDFYGLWFSKADNRFFISLNLHLKGIDDLLPKPKAEQIE